MSTPLLDRIEERRKASDKIVPLVERRKPRWLERKDERGLPAQDFTYHVTKEAA